MKIKYFTLNNPKLVKPNIPKCCIYPKDKYEVTLQKYCLKLVTETSFLLHPDVK